MKRFVVFLVAIAVSLAVAGLYLRSDAATVAGSSISRQSLDTELSTIASSADYQCYLSEEHQISTGSALPFFGTGTSSARGGDYATVFVDNWLGTMMTDRATAAVVRARGIEITRADRQAARGILVRHITAVLSSYASDLGSSTPGCGGSGEAVLSSLPGGFVARQVAAQADSAVLAAHAAGAMITSAGVTRYFHSHRLAFDVDCLSLIVVQSQATALQVEKALALGAPFGAVAAQASLTQRTAAAGGVAGCGLLEGTFLSSALSRVSPGGLTPPIKGNGYWWVVQLTKRTAEPLARIRSTVVTAIVLAGTTRSSSLVATALGSSPLSIDPRYGSAFLHPSLIVSPPAHPAPSSLELPSAGGQPAAQPALP